MAESEGLRGDSVETWSDGQRWELLARILDGKLSIQQACERHDLSAEILWSWLPAFRQGALRALDERMQQNLLARGAPPEALRFPELSGSLTELSIGDWIQTLYLAGKDATLTVEAEGAEHRLWCSAGTPIDAESGPLRGEAAAYQILGLESGRVLASLLPVSRDRTIHASAQALLLEGARRKDESNAHRHRREPVSGLERQDSSAPPVRRTSLGPLALSWLPQRGTTTHSRRMLTGALLSLPLLLCFARFGVPGTAPADRPLETYAVHCAVDPPNAALSLDRGPVGLGRLDATLPRNGQAHLLRASAEGFLPVTVVFSDAPPPDLIALERMPGAAPSLAASSCAVAPRTPVDTLVVTPHAEHGAPSSGPAPAPQRALPVPAPARMPLPSATPSRPLPSAAASKELANEVRQILSEQHAPRVQVIE
jgi:transposase-like protein